MSKRVKKEVIATGETTIFVYSSGKLVAEYSTAPPPPQPTTNYTATDMLGSPRVLTDSLGNVVSRRDFLPFGEELYADGVHRSVAGKYSQIGQDGVRQRFTGYEKDAETGLDFAEARMYANTYGRFTALDPTQKSVIAVRPQSWNRYVYCYNNPLKLVDKNGKWPSDTHDRLIDTSFAGLSYAERAAIKLGSRNIDYFENFKPGSTLWPSEAYKHVMTPNGMTQEEAFSAASKYLNDQLKLVKLTQKMYEVGGGVGISPLALVALGEATHVYEDMTSPAHGFDKTFSIPLKTVSVLNPDGSEISYQVYDLAKWKEEMDEHKDVESREPTDDEKARTAVRSRAFFLIAFGEKQFMRLDMTDEERKAARDLVEELRRKRKK